MKTVNFSKYPLINAQFGKTFGVLPPGLTGPARAAAEMIVDNAISSFEETEKVIGGTLGEAGLLPIVATAELSMNSYFKGLWVGNAGKNY